MHPVVRTCRVRYRPLAKRCRRTATGGIGRKVGQRVVEVGDPVIAGVVGATLARRTVDQIKRCAVADVCLTVLVLVEKLRFKSERGPISKDRPYQRGGGLFNCAKLGGGHGGMRSAKIVTSDDGVVARMIHNGIKESSVDRVKCLVSVRMKYVGNSTIWAEGFELRPVHHAKGLQAVHTVLDTVRSAAGEDEGFIHIVDGNEACNFVETPLCEKRIYSFTD